MPPVDSPNQPKLLTQLRRVVRLRHYSPHRGELRRLGAAVRTVPRDAPPGRARRARYPSIPDCPGGIGKAQRIESDTQALSAVLFLYRDVLHQDIGNIGDIPRAKQPARLPVVLSREECERCRAAAG
jgi:hypothetical protein